MLRIFKRSRVHAASLIGILGCQASPADDGLPPEETAGGKADELIDPLPIEGYAEPSVAAGSELTLRVSTEAAQFSIDFMRFGHEQSTLATIEDVPGGPQPIPPDDAYATGAQWEPSFVFTVPTHWDSGLYAARVYTSMETEFVIPFVVRETNPGDAPIAVLATNYTWHAYNCWGGASYYRCGCWTGPSTVDCSNNQRNKPIVSLERPLPNADPRADDTHLAGADKYIGKWLEREGYSYGMLAESDVQADPTVLQRYKTLVINAHSEYWTSQMYDGLVAFIEGGGNVLYLGGNAIHWKVTVQGNEMEVQKKRGMHSHTGEGGGLWRDLGRSPDEVLGVLYDLEAVSADTYAPFEVLEPTHWIFEGTGVEAGTRIGETGIVRSPLHDVGAASGWEMDAIVGNGPPNSVLVARAPNPLRPGLEGTFERGIGADMLVWDHAGGGTIFAASSITFTGSLVVDDILSKMMNNVLARLGHQPE